MNMNEAFGLPTGTVRAGIVVAVVLVTCYLAIIKQDITTAKELAGVLIGYYFGSKVNGTTITGNNDNAITGGKDDKISNN